jgi:hypothetical protein
VLCGLPCALDFPRPGFVAFVVGELAIVADGMGPAVGDGLADGGAVVPGAEDPGWLGAVPPVPPPPPEAGTPLTVAWPRGTVPACCELCVAGDCGATHCVKGACGPPVIATATATRHAAIAAMDPKPANRST